MKHIGHSTVEFNKTSKGIRKKFYKRGDFIHSASTKQRVKIKPTPDPDGEPESNEITILEQSSVEARSQEPKRVSIGSNYGLLKKEHLRGLPRPIDPKIQVRKELSRPQSVASAK